MSIPAPSTARLAQIVSVDLTNRKAKAQTRERSVLDVDTSYHVGGLSVTPAVGELWMIEQADMSHYRLSRRLQSNAAELNTDAVEGQVQIGASGPLVLNGTSIQASGPLQLASYATTARPSGALVGHTIFDVTLGKPIFFNGTGWVDAAGSSV